MDSPSVLIDGAVFENTFQVGIWRVFYEILNRLSSTIDITLWLRAPALQPLPRNVRIIQDSGRVPLRRADIYRVFKRKLLGTKPNLPGITSKTVFHSTYFTTKPLPNMPQVTSVYDMITESYFPIMGSWTQQCSETKLNELRKATRIIAISQSTADELVQFYPFCATRVKAIHLGGDHITNVSSQTPRIQGTPYALFVGARGNYKNFLTVLKALKTEEWPSNLLLRVVGTPFSPEETRLITALNITDRIVHLGRISDSELALQYASATCFIFPSLAEGFGLPIVEAQINRCPVLCSDIPVFHEIAGPTARYFDPRLDESLAKCVKSVLEHPIKEPWLDKAQDNAKKFSWENAAKLTSDIYRECIYEKT